MTGWKRTGWFKKGITLKLSMGLKSLSLRENEAYLTDYLLVAIFFVGF